MVESGNIQTQARHKGGTAGMTPSPLDGWEPIDTAPRDGTEIEMLIEGALYRYARPEERDDYRQAVRAHWIDHNGGGFTWHGLCGAPISWRPRRFPFVA